MVKVGMQSKLLLMMLEEFKVTLEESGVMVTQAQVAAVVDLMEVMVELPEILGGRVVMDAISIWMAP